jgi:hypothetical protein
MKKSNKRTIDLVDSLNRPDDEFPGSKRSRLLPQSTFNAMMNKVQVRVEETLQWKRKHGILVGGKLMRNFPVYKEPSIYFECRNDKFVLTYVRKTEEQLRKLRVVDSFIINISRFGDRQLYHFGIDHRNSGFYIRPYESEKHGFRSCIHTVSIVPRIPVSLRSPRGIYALYVGKHGIHMDIPTFMAQSGRSCNLDGCLSFAFGYHKGGGDLYLQEHCQYVSYRGKFYAKVSQDYEIKFKECVTNVDQKTLHTKGLLDCYYVTSIQCRKCMFCSGGLPNFGFKNVSFPTFDVIYFEAEMFLELGSLCGAMLNSWRTRPIKRMVQKMKTFWRSSVTVAPGSLKGVTLFDRLNPVDRHDEYVPQFLLPLEDSGISESSLMPCGTDL